MPKTKISEFSATPANNTDIDSINIAEGCAPSGINDAIRELMAQLKDFQTGAVGDSFNGPVGSTTASTGAFTTLSASGAVTLSGGTANGVAYLNGSKVLTSGSALTFDGTTFAQTGANGIPIRIQELASVPTSQTAAYIGVSTSAFPGSNNGDLILAPRTSGGNLIKFYTGNGTSAERYSIDSVGVAIWSVSGSEQMRLTSTGLGIGTSSPSQKLHVVAAGGYNSTFSENSANKVRLQFYIDANETALVSGYDTTAKPMTFYTGGSLRATLDSSGNLGLGVTPSAWGSAYKVIDAQSNGGSFGASGYAPFVACNAYQNGTNWIYKGSSFAPSYYSQFNGSHIWYNAPTGTAGNAITFTQAMTLDSSGRLLVGSTTAGGTDGGVDILPLTENGGIVDIRKNSSGANGDRYAIFRRNGTQIGSVTQNGTTGVLYNTTSDQRLKENIQDADSASSLIDSLQVRKFDWKSDNSHQRYGFVAQELVTVVPEAVHQPEDAEEMMAVDYSKLVPMLVKEVQSLRKRLADAGL